MAGNVAIACQRGHHVGVAEILGPRLKFLDC
jgi:hypothetical protein